MCAGNASGVNRTVLPKPKLKVRKGRFPNGTQCMCPNMTLAGRNGIDGTRTGRIAACPQRVKTMGCCPQLQELHRKGYLNDERNADALDTVRPKCDVDTAILEV